MGRPHQEKSLKAASHDRLFVDTRRFKNKWQKLMCNKPVPMFISQSWQFAAEAKMLSIQSTKPVTQLNITVERQEGETVLEGKARCYIFR